MHRRPVVEVFQATSNIRQLKKQRRRVFASSPGGILTSLSLLVAGHTATKSMMVPYSIHSEIITMVDGGFFAPTNRNRFGCLNCFHRTTSQQNFCAALISTCTVLSNRTETSDRTFSKLRKSRELTRKTLIATLEPRYVPRHTSALPPLPQGYSPISLSSSVVVYDGGSRPCSRHIFLSTMENLFRWWAHSGEPSREPSLMLAGHGTTKSLRAHLF